MTRIIGTYLALLAVLLSPIVADADQILVNPGFETGDFSGWTIGGTTPTTISSIANTGSHSAAALGNDFVRQDFTAIDTNDIIEFSFFVSREPLTTVFNFVEFFYLGGGSNNTLVSERASGFVFANLTSAILVDEFLTGFRVYGTSPGPAYLDDFLLDVRSNSVPEPGTLALLGIGLFGMGLARRKKTA